MTVKQLINRLKKMPEDSHVIFENDSCFNDGAYSVTKVVDYEDGTVVLESNHKKEWWGEKWYD